MIRLEFVRTEDAGDPHAFRTGPQDYLLRWPDGTFEPARLVWDDELLHQLAAVGRAGDPELVRRVGERLHRFLAATRFAALAAELRAALAAGRPAHLEIVAAAAELTALPWELLTPGDGRPLGETPGLQIRHAWPGTSAAPPVARPEGGRVFVAWSHAFGNVGEAHTLQAIAAACHAGFVAFDRARDVLADASLSALVARLEQRLAEPDPPTILHILAHGAADGPRYGLGLHDDRGAREVVDPAALRRALAPFADRLRLVVLLACDSGNPGPPGAHLGSAVQELHRAGFAAVVGSRHPLTGAGALAFTRAFYQRLLVDTDSVDHAFTAARTGLARGAGLEWASLQLYRPPGAPDLRPVVFRPHRGLLAFEREHARFFFGRDPERREALADLQALVAGQRPRLLVVTGASGTGKSSVVLAGLVPEALALGWSALVLRPGAAPLRALEEALARRGDDARPLLLVVDQFEEAFTHAPAAARQEFVRRLWDMSQSSDGLTRVVLTLRVDYLGRCGELALDDAGLRLDRVAYDEAHRVFVAQLAPDRLLATITGPSERLGLTLEPGLPARLLHEIGGDPVGLPLLQYALDELWQRRSATTLTHAALDAIGGVHGALARHADAVIDALDPAEQLAARRLLVRLVVYGPDRASGTRRRVALASLRTDPPAAFDRAVTALIAARLLVRRADDGDEHATLEVAHEALIRHWDRLWRWYEEARANLTRAAELAALVGQAREHREHLAGNRLVHAEALARGLADDLEPATRTFLQTSRAAADRSRRTRTGITAAALLVLLVGVTVVAWLALEARRQAARAGDAARLMAAQNQLTTHPHVAADLLREVDAAAAPDWRALAYETTLAALPISVLESAAPPISAAALAPDGAALISGHDDGSLRIWPLAPNADASLLLVDPGTPGASLPVFDLLAQPADGGYTILAARHDRLALWRRDASVHLLASGEIVTPPPNPPVRLDPRFQRNPTTGRIARLHDHGALHVWDQSGPTFVARAVHDACLWSDPTREQQLCGQDATTVGAWTGPAPLGSYTRAALADQPIDPAAALLAHRDIFHDPATAVIVDEPRKLLLTLEGADTPHLTADRLVWLSAGQLCQRPRDASAPTQCATVDPACAEIAAVHPHLGALLHCQGTRRQAQFAEVRPRIGIPEGELHLRHTIALPDSPAVALHLTTDDRLVVTTRDAQIWQWDLRALPSGYLGEFIRDTAALVDGDLAVIDLVHGLDASEVHHTRWAAPTGPPTRAHVALPPPALDPCCAVAGPSGWAAAFRPHGTWVNDREYGDFTARGDVLALGGFPLAAPQRVALTLGNRAAVLAATPDLATLALSTGDAVEILDRGAPTRARLRLPAPRDPAIAERPPHALRLAAIDPQARTAVFQWTDEHPVVVDLASGVIAPLRAPGPARCNNADPTSQPLAALAYAPDGRWLATARRSGRLELLPLTPAGLPDPAATTAVACLEDAEPSALTFTADAAVVLAGSTSGGLSIWSDFTPADAPTSDALHVQLPGRPHIAQLAHAGAHLLARTADGRVWFAPGAVTTAALQTRLAAITRVCATPAERERLLHETTAPPVPDATSSAPPRPPDHRHPARLDLSHAPCPPRQPAAQRRRAPRPTCPTRRACPQRHVLGASPPPDAGPCPRCPPRPPTR